VNFPTFDFPKTNEARVYLAFEYICVILVAFNLLIGDWIGATFFAVLMVGFMISLESYETDYKLNQEVNKIKTKLDYIIDRMEKGGI